MSDLALGLIFAGFLIVSLGVIVAVSTIVLGIYRIVTYLIDRIKNG